MTAGSAPEPSGDMSAKIKDLIFSESTLTDQQTGQPFHLFFELRQLFLKPRLGQQHRFRRIFSCGSLSVGGV